MIRVLINSYACCPNMGSEPGMGWNWIVSLAQYCECYVISEGEFRPQVEHWLSLTENEAIASRLHFYWLPIGGNDAVKSARVRKMCWNQGDWRFYFYYRKWQQQAARQADEIIAHQPTNIPIQILHQLNMIGFREPGYLWRTARKYDIPLVWGPINAKEGFPMAYARNASLRQRTFLFLKNAITKVQLAVMPRVRRMARMSNVIIAASSDAQHSIEKYWHKRSICINESGCPSPTSEVRRMDNTAAKQFDVLWCGRMIFSKQLDVAIRAMAKADIPNAVLHVVGGGDDKEYRKLADKTGANVRWYGQVSHDEVQKLMRQMDLLLFTSVFEGTPHVVLEAIVNQLPVVCYSTCGQGDVVNDSVGKTIPLSDPEKSSHDFAEVLTSLYTHPEQLMQRRANCISRAKELTWDSKALQMLDIYKSL